MTALPEQHSNVVNVHLKATEHNEQIIFLHAVEQGPASQSYGLQVAQLAGVPASVIKQAKKQLQRLEQGNHTPPAATANVHSPLQADMFASALSAVEERLADIDPDELTPKAALELVYELRKLGKF